MEAGNHTIAPVQNFLQLLQLCRQSTRLIQAVTLAFVLSWGAAAATPAIQAHNLSPDQQLICMGTGGMKLVTFAADGTATESAQPHVSQCLLCAALQALPLASHAGIGLQAMATAQPLLVAIPTRSDFECRTPPARAPPLAS